MSPVWTTPIMIRYVQAPSAVSTLLKSTNGGQDQHAYHHLDQHDQVRGQVLEALGDRRRHGVENGRSQGQADAEHVVGAGGLTTALGGHDQHQPGEGQHQPANLGGAEAFSEKQHTQTDQHERLNVVDHRGNGDRGMFVGTE